MNRIYLVRHGEKESQMGDPALTSVGKEQAEKTAHYLSTHTIHGIWSSPSLRTRQTAEIIAENLKIPIQIDTALRERMDWHLFPSLSFDKFLEIWDTSTKDRYFTPPSGDSSKQAGDRIQSFVEGSTTQTSKTLLYVTHGGVISDFLRNIFPYEVLKEYMVEHSSKSDVAIGECSVTILEYEKGKYSLVTMASTEHLEKKKV
jgi:broad specificity phosphatase PhoE